MISVGQHIVGKRAADTRRMPVTRAMAGLSLIAVFAALMVFPTHAAEPSSPPAFSLARATQLPTLEECRRALAADSQARSAAGELSGSAGAMALMSVPAGTMLDSTIDELARGLRYDPALMYRFVHDSIEFDVQWGDVKGAAMTLMDRRGGAIDQASLLIALLTKAAAASGAPHTITDIKYEIGLIQLNANQTTAWLGVPNDAAVASQVLTNGGIAAYSTPSSGAITSVTVRHAWVKATIDGQVYEFDPSFKSHLAKTGLSGTTLAQAMQYTATDFLSTTGGARQNATVNATYVKDLNRTNIENKLTTYSTNLITYIRNNYPAGDISDIIGGETIVPAEESTLPPATLPYTKSGTPVEYTFGNLPSTVRTKLKVQHQGIDVDLWSSDIYGRRLTITYNTSNQPELRLDGNPTPIETGTACNLETEYNITLSVNHPYDGSSGTYCDQTRTQTIKAGGFWLIANSWGLAGTNIIELHRRILEQNRHEGCSDSSPEVLGESFALVGLTWLAQVSRTSHLAAQIGGCTITDHHRLGITGQYDAPYIDIPLGIVSITSDTDNADDVQAVFFTCGGQSSAYEHGVIHQLQDCGAVSTVKLLTAANDLTTSDDKIYCANSANWSTVQNALQGYSDADKNSINTKYIQNGFTVYLPQQGRLTEGVFSGYGYMATRIGESTMEAGYIIAAGQNGGYSTSSSSLSIPQISSYTVYDPVDINVYGNTRVVSSDPIDLMTGCLLYDHSDLMIGNGGFPFGLQLDRSYNSARRFEDGPFGLGWTHGYDITTKVGSDSFQAMGDDSPVDAAANIAVLYVTFDLFHSPSLLNSVVASISEKWLMDQMIDNTVVVENGHKTMQFVKLPDGSFNPPPGKAVKLIKETDNTYLLKDNAGGFLDFDSNNRAVRWSDPHGNVVDFAYTSGKLSTVISRIGGGTTVSRSLTFTYDVNHVDTVADSAGRSISFDYDTAGNLISYSDPEDYVTTFQYYSAGDANDGLMWKVFYPDRPTQPYATHVYDSLGRVMRQTNAAGQIYDYFYSYYRTEELEPSQTPPGGTATRYSKVYYFDDRGNTIGMKDQLGRTTATVYDGHQRPTKVTSPAGNHVEYAYDENHNVTQTTRVAAAGSSDPNIVESAVYDAHTNAVGRWFVNLQQATDAAGNTTAYTYDYEVAPSEDVGNLRTVTYPQVPIPGGTAVPTVQYTYNPYGQKLTEVSPESVTTRYEYYTAAQGAGLMKTIIDSGTGRLNLTTEMTYDNVGNVATTKDPRGNITTAEYDARRLPIWTVSPAPFNYETSYDYYEDGKVRQVRTLPKVEGEAIRAPDLVGANHGIITGTPRWVEGTAGLALQTDASGGHVIVPDADALTPSSTLSVSFWAYWKGSGRVGVYKYAPGADSRSYYVQVLEDGKVQCAIFETGVVTRTYNYDVLTTTSSISANAWHHIVMVFNAGAASLYVDGASSASKTMYVTSIANDGQPLILGGYYTGTLNPALAGALNGAIDEVCIFNRAVTTTEITSILRDNGIKGISAIAGLTAANYPVAYWSFDDQPVTATSFYTYTPTGQKATVTGPMDDTIAHDSIKNYHGDVRGNVVWATGRAGTAIQASSTNGGSVVIPDADALTPGTAMSLAFWVNWAGTQATGIYKYASADGSRSYFVEVGTDSKIRFTVFSGPTTYSTMQSTTLIAKNRWRHVVVTFNAGAAAIYVNGTQYGTSTMTATSIINDGQPLIIGGFWSGLTRTFVPRFNGIIDELCLFNRALTAAEVTQLCNNGTNRVSALTGFTPANYPVGYWSFDEAQVNYTQYTYDSLDRPWAVTDARGIATETRYYPDGQVYRVIGDSGTGHLNRNTITNTYNTNGTLNTVADARNNTTTYTYDGHLRPKRTTYANNTCEEVTYDDYGRVQQTLNRAGQIVSFTYDALNRVRTKTLPAPTTKTITYEYDRAGRLINTIDAGGTTETFTNGYDRANRLLSVTYPGGRVVSYQYDAAGNRTRLNYPFDSYYVTYAYDELNRLTNIKNPSNQILAQYTYDGLSRRRALLYGNQTGSHYLYDGSSRLKSVETYMIGESFRYAYDYDNVGNRKSMLVNDTDLHNYTYDNTYWLTGTDHPTGFFTADTTFSYDNTGNRTSVVSGGTTSYTVNNLNQYNAVGGTSYTYDNNGNLLTDGSGKTYAYDALNRMISVTGGTGAAYTYGPDGQRRTRAIGTTTTTFYYDGMDVIAEAVGSTCSRKFVHGPGANEPVCMIASGQTYYYHYDGLGSVVAVSVSGTNVPQKYVYNAYGQCQAAGTDVGNPYRFTGYRLDTETGLYFAHARHYNASIGRFLQTDPIGYGDGINWYLYGRNNPLVIVDPWGLCGLWKRDWDEASAFNHFLFGWGETVQFAKDSPFPLWAADAGGGMNDTHRTLTQTAVADQARAAFNAGASTFSLIGEFPQNNSVYVYKDLRGMGTLSLGNQDEYSQVDYSASGEFAIENGEVIAHGTVTYAIEDLYTWEKYPAIQFLGAPFWQKLEFDKSFSVKLGSVDDTGKISRGPSHGF